MTTKEIQPTEYAPFYAGYIKAAENSNLLEELEICLHEFIKFVQNIPMDKFDYRYAPDKWTIKEIIQHLIDSERVFAYRALRISRKDTTALPGFDQNDYVANSDANLRNLQGLLTELAVVRQASLYLFKSFAKEQLTYTGIASTHAVSVRAIGFIIIGHQKHHQSIFEQRYLLA
ncbi:DinB family protein [Flavobacterium crassostreae]|uniref:Damage-inducible protein DinB n=1 Tax=Flavobacterium crassostreae TaxID=1763534 RepID=A0A1B9E9D8_9FLAO|nr:DinB family protein [Flavobacterium crassostreae]OCB78580.1 damage-inducible protein DinB [Flavobacterium crassostreae]